MSDLEYLHLTSENALVVAESAFKRALAAEARMADTYKHFEYLEERVRRLEEALVISYKTVTRRAIGE